MKNNVTRRRFITASTALAGGFAAGSTVYPSPSPGSSSDPLRWGIIGVGNRAKAHLSAFNNLDSCEVVALCDIREEALQDGLSQLKKGQPKTFKKYQELLEQADVDAVCIVVPNFLHHRITIDSLAAGKHILCEKPMGVTLEESAEVVAVAKKTDRVLQYGMQLRHSPTFAKVHELVQSGAIGNIRYAWISDFRQDIRQLYQDPVKEHVENWRYFQDLTGGMLLEYSIHRLDLLNWWMNSKPIKISAFGGHNVWRDRETIDHCGILIEYANGAKATYGMTLYSAGFDAPWLIMGDEGQMLIEGGSRVVIQKKDVSNSLDSPLFKASEEAIDLPAGGDPTLLQYHHFERAVREGIRPFPDWRIAYDALWLGVQGESAIRNEEVQKL